MKGGVWADGSDRYVPFGTTWSDFPVTYSFMADGIADPGGDFDPSTIPSHHFIRSCEQLPAIFSKKFAMHSWREEAVTNITFQKVADSGDDFNAATASGDIRIGAHPFDGAGGTLAHAFFPPPNGATAAGDMHFDTDDSWDCVDGAAFDSGIVTIHEIGHSIGLEHEPTITAVMNPFYNSSLTALLPDDINGGRALWTANMYIVNTTDDTDDGVCDGCIARCARP